MSRKGSPYHIHLHIPCVQVCDFSHCSFGVLCTVFGTIALVSVTVMFFYFYILKTRQEW